MRTVAPGVSSASVTTCCCCAAKKDLSIFRACLFDTAFLSSISTLVIMSMAGKAPHTARMPRCNEMQHRTSFLARDWLHVPANRPRACEVAEAPR